MLRVGLYYFLLYTLLIIEDRVDGVYNYNRSVTRRTRAALVLYCSPKIVDRIRSELVQSKVRGDIICATSSGSNKRRLKLLLTNLKFANLKFCQQYLSAEYSRTCIISYYVPLRECRELIECRIL
jgi:hypothetical protein